MKRQRLAVGEHAPDLTLLDQNGQSVTLSERWRSGPLFLNFLRHFG
ncbi:MAG: hypothetical protein HXY40_07210 [Chloroflexi bacterium]|nr:hypothetical protein [Chloroflexota bacterium]